MCATTKPASALLLATLTAALLATAAAVVLVETQSARASANESLRFARARLADAALIASAIARIDGDTSAPRRGLVYADATGQVERQDAAGLVDINTAQPQTLATLFRGLGAASERANALGDAIADWRDSDSLKHLLGAEAEDYLTAHLAPPRNGPFQTETELLLVMGMDRTLLACALPYITVFSGAPTPDIDGAPSALARLLALPPASPAEAASPLGGVIILQAEAPLSANATLNRKLWLRLSGDPHKPVLIHRAEETLAPRAPLPPPDCPRAQT